jgi:hypothetical protein
MAGYAVNGITEAKFYAPPGNFLYLFPCRLYTPGDRNALPANNNYITDEHQSTCCDPNGYGKRHSFAYDLL